MYKPSTFNTPLQLWAADTTTEKGVVKKTYVLKRDLLGSFRTWGGTERVSNDILVVENTAVVETWHAPDITASCRVVNLRTGAAYEIIGEPEDIEQHGQYTRFKVRAVKGGA
jgi:hypothetical protein